MSKTKRLARRDRRITELEAQVEAGDCFRKMIERCRYARVWNADVFLLRLTGVDAYLWDVHMVEHPESCVGLTDQEKSLSEIVVEAISGSKIVAGTLVGISRPSQLPDD